MDPHRTEDPAAELRRLQHAYASALDGRDAEGLCRLFHPDAELRIFPPGATEPASSSRGHETLLLMVEAMRKRYQRTMHVVTNDTCQVSGETATGSVYCVAHHLIADDGGVTKFAAYVLYADSFSRRGGGDWRFSRRDIHFLWTESCPVLPWDEAVEVGRLA